MATSAEKRADESTKDNEARAESLVGPDVLAQIQALVGQIPLSNPTANINYNVHQGTHAQVPFARLEDFMAPLARYGSFEDMAAAEKSVAAAQGKEPSMQKRANGTWYRRVSRHAGGTPVLRDGQVFHVKEWVSRPVALSIKEARQGQADYFDGRTWIRDGLKAEQERFTAFQAHRDVEQFLEPASAAETAQVRSAAMQKHRDTPELPNADPGLKVADSGKKDGE